VISAVDVHCLNGGKLVVGIGNINGRDVQKKNVVNNADKSS